MKVVTVNGVSYLAVLEESENGGIVLKDALALNGTNVSQMEVTDYYKKGNLGQLKVVTFGGSGISYSVADITDDIVMFCKIADLALEQAKKVAVKNLENMEFSNVLGKM